MSSFSPATIDTCRFASKRRFVCTFEWLTADPNAAVFPQIAQARGISGISSAGGIEVNGTVARIATQCDGTTLLRVLEAAADPLERPGDESGDLAAMLRRVVDAGAEAVARTRQENPVNKAAGVVDAGAKGLWYLLDGALAALEDRSPTISAAATRSQTAPARAVASEVSSWAGAYDVQFLVEHPSRPIEDVRAEMTKFGADCVLVVGDESVMK